MHPAEKLVPIALAALLAGSAPPAVAGQEAEDAGESAGDEIRTAMSTLPDLEGRWQGEGWMRRGPGESHRFTSEEIVERRLDGQILLVEGIHHSAEDPSEKVLHAFAVVSYDPEADAYRFRSHTDSGRGGDFRGRVEDGAFIWGHEVPAGRIRYTIRVEGDRWEEIGEFSPDGESWSQFFEMKLDRVE